MNLAKVEISKKQKRYTWGDGCLIEEHCDTV